MTLLDGQGPVSAPGRLRVGPAGAGPGESASGALARCLSVPRPVFVERYWGRRPLLSRAADLPQAFTDLLSPADVDLMVTRTGLRTPFVKLVADGVNAPERSWTRRITAGDRTLSDLADAEQVRERYAAGATVVLNSLHRTWPAVVDFCRDLAADLGHPVQANAYVTPPTAQGFRPHHDTHDVLVLQLDGVKTWHVAEPVLTDPVVGQPSSALDLPDGVEHSTFELREGDCLYLPRGWVHWAQTEDQPSLHLTVGLLTATRFDLLRDVVEQAKQRPGLRGGLPPGAGGPGGHVSDLELEGFLTEVRAWAAELSVDSLREVIAPRLDRAVPLEPVGVLAQDAAARTLQGATRVRPRRGLRWQLSERTDKVDLVLAQRTITVPVQYADPLRVALSGPSTANQLGCDPADGLVLIRRLLREGVLTTA